MREEEVVEPGVGEHAADGMQVADGVVRCVIAFLEHHDRVDGARQQSSAPACETLAILSIKPGRTITANGCSIRPSWALSSPEDSSMQARWNPPTPRIARIFPASSSAAASRTGSSHGTSVPGPIHEPSPGPQVWQAIVCAWWRRECGSPVLPRAGSAHRKSVHACPLPVVRDLLDDAVPGPAVHAGGCPVPLVSPATGKNIRDTIVADRNIGRDHPGKRTGPAFLDHKTVRDIGRRLCHINRIDPGHRRAPGDCRKKVSRTARPGRRSPLRSRGSLPSPRSRTRRPVHTQKGGTRHPARCREPKFCPSFAWWCRINLLIYTAI